MRPLKHDTAVRRLEKLDGDIASVQAELTGLADCEFRYAEAVKAKLEEIKRSGSRRGDEVYRLEESLAYLRGQIKEVDEALDAGNAAVNQILSIEESLDSAEGWGVFDMLGGGMMSAMAKHSHLDEAQEQVENLQYMLSRFRTELTDIRINADMQLQIDGFLRFADYFFDGFIVDWAVLDRINESQAQVAGTKSQVYKVLEDLHEIRGGLELDVKAVQKKLNKIALD